MKPLNAMIDIAYNNKGNVLDKQGKFNEAIKCYDKAIGINPNYVDAYNNKGNALYKQGKFNEAIKCCLW